MKDWFRISEFSKMTGLSLKALRIYEEKKLLVSHERGENNYRYFSAQQIELARHIVKYKEMGFSLEQIKLLIQLPSEQTLAELIADKLNESKNKAVLLKTKILKLEELLSSLNNNHPLTDEQKGEIMESLYSRSINNLKRLGLQSTQTELLLKSEIDHMSPAIQKLLPELQKMLQTIKEHDILIGPGRANTPASMVLFGEKYSQLNPTDFDLMPETFAQSKIFMLDVEFSNSELVGKMCTDISKKINFEVVAFKSPFLDIIKAVQNQVGQIDFDKVSDFDPRILGAPRLYGRKGLFGVDWNPDFEAFRRASSEFRAAFSYTQEQLDDVYLKQDFKSPIDFINVDTLVYSFGINELSKYRDENHSSIYPELDYTNGLLLYREDLLRIYMNRTQVNFDEAYSLLRSMVEYPERHQESDLYKIENLELRKFIYDSIPAIKAKSHAVSWWWYYKRTAVLKAFWGDIYLDAIKKWEDQNQMIWQEFGFKDTGGYHLKA